MAWRESIEIPPLNHGNTPIPMASKVGNMLFTSGIFGRDPDTNELPESAEEQCANCLKNLGRVLEKAGSEAGRRCSDCRLPQGQRDAAALQRPLARDVPGRALTPGPARPHRPRPCCRNPDPGNRRYPGLGR